MLARGSNDCPTFLLGEIEEGPGLAVQANVPAHGDVALILVLFGPAVVIGLHLNQRSKDVLIGVRIFVSVMANDKKWLLNASNVPNTTEDRYATTNLTLWLPNLVQNRDGILCIMQKSSIKHAHF